MSKIVFEHNDFDYSYSIVEDVVTRQTIVIKIIMFKNNFAHESMNSDWL